MKRLFTDRLLIISILTLSLGLSFAGFSQSVLRSGHWYKVAVENDGIYQLTYQDFADMGFDITNIDPAKIQVYGNIEGVLPEPNNIVVPHDLLENAIYVHGQEDSSFDPGDYVAFYAKGPNKVEYERLLERFRYNGHPYSDLNYYFITVGETDGKRIENVVSSTETPYKTVTDFLDFQYHEVDLVNFVKSGRKWFGENFDENPVLHLDFDYPNLNNEKNVKFGTYAAGRSTLHSIIQITPLGSTAQELILTKIQGNYQYAKEAESRLFYYTDANNVSFDLTYSKPDASSNAWLDYFEVNAYQYLKMNGHQMAFNFDVLLDTDKFFEFQLSDAHENLSIWEVTNPYEVKNISGYDFDNGILSFCLQLPRTHYFVAFDEQGFLRPEFAGQVANQDLKSAEPFDLAIITIDDFKSEAQRLADFHAQNDQLTTLIVTPQEIYNEFSSGKQDPAAIRNFLRYHYNKSQENYPKYLLLFGDASYDYKAILPDNTNIVPVFQSIGSTSTTDTYNTDDFFGIFGQLDGDSSFGEVQLAIGRFPVNNQEDAKIMVDKTIAYARNQIENIGEWRNKVCFIADDEDSNLHFNDSNRLADTFLLTHPEFNVDKIFLDSYVQQSTSNGYRYPDVTAAINRKVDEGVLFFNYTGHGGHLSLTDERILQIADVTGWKNIDKQVIWIVASCEFGPFDNPHHISAGEHVVLNPYGGGPALFTTTRLAYASYNFRLNQKFHEIAFSRKEDGSHYRMGEIIKYAKNESGNDERNLNFSLLGDPALKIAYPEYHVETTHINGEPLVQMTSDTLKARQTVTLKGKVTGLSNETLTDFDGMVEVKIFGKPSVYSTLANDPKSFKSPFEVTDLVIYNGSVKAQRGEFEFTFVVPSVVANSLGQGKISYYATDTLSNGTYYDANGGYPGFVIGGTDQTVEADMEGPEMHVFLETRNFNSGDPTSTDPVMMVDLSDANGIDNISLDFGREIQANLDKETTFFLNDYYTPDLTDYRKGQVNYQLKDLTYGNHEISVKAWDVFDNSTEKTVSFMVISPQNFSIFDLRNEPNPFKTTTSFEFEHNQTEENYLNVQIRIYDIIGKLVWQIEKQATVIGNTVEPINMAEGNSFGNQINTGVYTYILEATNSEGQKVKEQQKLLIIK